MQGQTGWLLVSRYQKPEHSTKDLATYAMQLPRGLLYLLDRCLVDLGSQILAAHKHCVSAMPGVLRVLK